MVAGRCPQRVGEETGPHIEEDNGPWGQAEAPPTRLNPRAPSSLIVGAVIALLVVGIVLLLATGGPEASAERRGDLSFIQGVTPKNRQGGDLVASIADVTAAEIHKTDGGYEFMVETAAALPQKLKISALEFRWDIVGDDGVTWTLTATVDDDIQVALFSAEGYGSGTVDQTFPGDIAIDDTTLMVTMRDEVPGFPSTFDWSLATTLRAFRDETDSPRVEDRFPDEGTMEFKR